MAGDPKRILLVGAGHGHLGVIRDAGEWPAGVRGTVVASGDFWYSGLATGVLGGQFDPERDRVDVAELCRRVGLDHVEGRLVGLDPDARVATVQTDYGERRIGYDVLSLNLGSEPVPLEGAEPDGRRVFAVKPLKMLSDLRRRVEGDHGLNIVVCGGGYSGSECALNLAQLPGGHRVTLLTRGKKAAGDLPGSAPDHVAAKLAEAGVDVRRGTEVTRVTDDAVEFDGSAVPADVVLLAAGLRPPRLTRDLGLETDEKGHLLIDETLQCLGRPDVFAVGDAAEIDGRDPLPKIGVVAVFQARLLRHNLPAAALGKRHKRYKPGARRLLILNLGDGTGLATWGGLHWHGRSAMWLKRQIDLRWLGGFR